MDRYYEINEDVARRAKGMMSFSDYREGSATASYRSQIDRVAEELEEVKGKCKTEAQRDRAEYFFDKYARVLALAINRDNEIGTRCPSVMISGGSNFPVRKKEKQVAAWDANRENFDKAAHYLCKMRRAHCTPVASDDPEVIEYLKSKLERLEKTHAAMKEGNAYYRKHKTLDGCPGVSNKTREWLTRPGVFAQGDGSPLALYGCPFPSYALTTSNAAIKRVRERLEKLEAAKATKPVEVEHDGYTYKEDAELMRVQFFFDGKPDEETRSLLKSNGFRWAPSQGAWQRQLTENGKRAAKRVMEEIAQ